MELLKKKHSGGKPNKVRPTADMIDPNATYTGFAVQRITGFGWDHIYRLMNDGIVRFERVPNPKGGSVKAILAINGADLQRYVASFTKGIGLLRPRSPKPASRRQYPLAVAA